MTETPANSPLPAHPDHPNLRVVVHPLIAHKMTHLRDRHQGRRTFRALAAQISGLMVYEATRTFPTARVDVETPLEHTVGENLLGVPTIAPILRAGLGMSSGVLEMLPTARVAHIGLERDESTLEPAAYLSKIPPDLSAGPVLMVDPMLATGGSAARAASMLKDAGAVDLRMICLVAVPEGVRKMMAEHPDVPIFAAALDRELDESGFIRPGLGDAGDRLFGTDEIG
jgi:uracil phosphoribosyltransferase